METALAEGAEQGRLAHARVSNQDHFEEAVRGEQGAFFCLLMQRQKKLIISGGNWQDENIFDVDVLAGSPSRQAVLSETSASFSRG